MTGLNGRFAECQDCGSVHEGADPHDAALMADLCCTGNDLWADANEADRRLAEEGRL